MKNDTVVSMKMPAAESVPLSSLLCEGARAILHDALEAELTTYLSGHAGERDGVGRRCIVQNGYLPARTLMTGLGDVPIRVPTTRDRVRPCASRRQLKLPPQRKIIRLAENP